VRHLQWLVVFLLCGLAVFSVGRRVAVYGASDADAVAAIADAEERLVRCYEAVAEANAAGANVTGLLGQLNQAADLLSRAESLYRYGSFDVAVSLARQSYAELEGFLVDADALTERAAVANQRDLLVNVVGSGVGAVGVLCAAAAVWYLSKKKAGGRAT
jgi:hypothetical protein